MNEINWTLVLSIPATPAPTSIMHIYKIVLSAPVDCKQS